MYSAINLVYIFLSSPPTGPCKMPLMVHNCSFKTNKCWVTNLNTRWNQSVQYSLCCANKQLNRGFCIRNILNTCAMNYSNVSESYWKPIRSYIKPLSSENVICVVIRISYIGIWFREIFALPIWKKANICKKTRVKIITCSAYREHTATVLLASTLLSVTEIDSNMVGISMYNSTVKPVCNDHLFNKTYYLWFIQ